ncbi:competence protein ComEC [Lutibacter agarilyticus]|uniref:Competence protein ComEC n=1 Tax=Lutibacter agarilyticus TaxID=1109740 RepID=A0A238WLD3_9FLAO|nr:ComEC/Rec2 family competence protein [Lutibacter agarilyticus]SNR47103.1 competence protein ComEC [Lutibacter agarilyticus]
MRKFWKFIPFQLTLFLLIGILLGNYYLLKPEVVIYCLVFLVFLFFGAYFYTNKPFKNTLVFSVFFYLLTINVGIATVTLNKHVNKPLYFENQSEFSTSEVQKIVLSVTKVLKPTTYLNKHEAVVVQLNSKRVVGKVLVNIQKDSLSKVLDVDYKFLTTTVFKAISEPKNPYEFNYKNYLKNQQIEYQIYLKSNEILLVDTTTRTLKGVASNIRKVINESLQRDGFKGNQLAVINALLLGQRQQISYDLMQSYTGAGAIHILAVSGLHVGIILLILTFLLKPLHQIKQGKLVASILIVVALWIFALIAGLSASVVRAVTMFTAITIGMYSNRPTNMYNTLLISMFFLLIFHPNYIFDVGFQLSYLAVFSIVWIQPKLYQLIEIDNWLFNKLWQLFTVSMAAQIGVLPLSLYYFHQFPGLFLVSNLVIIPFLGIILITGVLIIVLSVLGILPSFLMKIYTFIIQSLNAFVEWISNQEFFIIQHITFSILVMLTFYAFILFTFKWFEKNNFYRLLLVVSSIIAIQTVIIFEKYKLESAHSFIVFNKSKESIVGVRNGNKLEIQSSSKVISTFKNPLKSFLVGTGIDSIVLQKKKINFIEFNGERIFIVDSLGLYQLNSIQPTMVVLRQSPKVNLNRLILFLKPNIIIADGSNYKSYVEQWKQTCVQTKTPFYSTMQNGAYKFSD